MFNNAHEVSPNNRKAKIYNLMQFYNKIDSENLSLIKVK